MEKLINNSTKHTKATEPKDTANSTTPKTVLEAFEYIVEAAEGSKLNEEFFTRAAKPIKYASRKLHLTAMQTVLLALFVDRSENSSILMSEIAEYTKCRTTRFLRLREDIDALEAKHYLRTYHCRNSLRYRVPAEVIASICKNQPYVYVRESVADIQDFFDRINKLTEEKNDNEITYEQFRELTMEMLEEIKDTIFASKLRTLRLGKDDTMLFIYMAHLFVEDQDDNIGFYDIKDLYDDSEVPTWVKREFRQRDSQLFEDKLIENVNEDGMARSDAFKLTEWAKKEFLGELNIHEVGKSEKGLIQSSLLAAKELVYNDSEIAQISELTSILSQERFLQVQERLEKAGMRKGFCCLLYGAPGTGKTETVYQLARQTGRNIQRVDVDKIKSCWVGESEKNIKALFDRYRAICQNAERVPILLFNEADAVLGVRMEGASHAVDKMENSIQNIILQEMETLEGIMIATTNLTINLDKAFERRFLYKIRFDKPTPSARARIWKIMLPTLSDSDAQEIASQFDLSGGQIENVARRHSVNSILSGDLNISLQSLQTLCGQERLQSSSSRIGF